MILTEGNRYVAFFDILGFKNWVETEGSRKVFDYIRDFMSLMIRVSMPKSKINADMSVDLEPSIIYYINFSDTIVFYSRDDSYEAFRTILLVCAEFMNVIICGPTRAIRGALSCGEFYVDTENNAYVGQALIDAYELEEKQYWLGVSLHGSIENTANFVRAQKEFPNLIIQSLVPIKNSSNKPFCVNWTNKNIIPASFNILRSLDGCLNKGLNALKDDPVKAEKLKIRISNTRDFVKHCQRIQS